MTDLSREAMQLMELSPAWQLRGLRRDEGAARDREGIMIVALARNEASRKLWDAIGRAMVRLGYPGAAIQDAVILNGWIADRVDAACASRMPATIFVFGKELDGLLRQSSESLVSASGLCTFPSLEEMTSREGGAKAKRALWSALIGQLKS